MVRSTDRPAMTIAVDLGRKATKQIRKVYINLLSLLKKRKIQSKRYSLNNNFDHTSVWNSPFQNQLQI